jgi:hypothetical protein
MSKLTDEQIVRKRLYRKSRRQKLNALHATKTDEQIRQDTKTCLCNLCKKTKDSTKFVIDRGMPGGLTRRCQECLIKARKIDHESIEGRARTLVQYKERKSNLSRSWAEERLRHGVCELTGIPFDLSNADLKKRNWRSPSIDKIDPNGEYTVENCRMTIYGVNAMMNNWGVGPILEVADAIRRNQYEG